MLPKAWELNYFQKKFNVQALNKAEYGLGVWQLFWTFLLTLLGGHTKVRNFPMKERKDLRDCHYGLYPAVTFAILGLIAVGIYLELQLHAMREEVLETYEEFYEKYDWDSIVYESSCNYFMNYHLL